MVCYYSVSGIELDIGFCHERTASGEQSWPEMYASKHTQKCNKNGENRWWDTNWLWLDR